MYDNILFKQFVVHIQHRKTIMTLTHKSVFAGYLGMHRVTERVFLTVTVLEFRETSADYVDHMMYGKRSVPLE